MIPLGVLASARPAAGGGLTHTHSSYVSTGASSYTWTAAPIGAASAARLVVVTVSHRTSNSRFLSTVTIGGAPASVILNGSSAFRSTGVAWLAVPSGTTADVAVTWNGTTAIGFLNVWVIDGSSVSLIGSSASPSSDGTSPDALTCTSVAGGYALGVAYTTGTATGSITLSGDVAADFTQNSPAAAAGSGPTSGTTATLNVAYPSVIGLVLAAIEVTP